MRGELILGIESAIGGGSLAIFENGKELASRTGESYLSRAEEILPNINGMLNAIERKQKDLTTVVVSTGPGSFTGIRVGIATALGLRDSLRVRCLGMTALEALAYLAGDGIVTAALPVGRDMICVQHFTGGRAESPLSLVTVEQFNDLLSRKDTGHFVVHGSIYERFAASPIAFRITNGGENIASLLCRASESALATEEIHPLFIDRGTFAKSSA